MFNKNIGSWKADELVSGQELCRLKKVDPSEGMERGSRMLIHTKGTGRSLGEEVERRMD